MQSNLDALDAIRSGWFRAPSNAAEADMYCFSCGQPIRSGEVIREDVNADYNYIHETCYESLVSDEDRP